MKIALQLYSIKDISEKEGLCAALDKAKELGYDGVEFAGLFGLTPEEAYAELEKRGLECAGFHEGFYSSPEKGIAMVKACKAASICVPHFAADTVEGWTEFAKQLNENGKKYREAGILYGYHNHIHEHRAIDGKMPIDIIFENCDKENVFYEMDTRHVALSECDVVEYAEKYADRIKILHARDTNGEHDCAVGAGIVDFEAVVAKTGVPAWFIVENENFGKNEKELADSVTYLRNTFGK